MTISAPAVRRYEALADRVRSTVDDLERQMAEVRRAWSETITTEAVGTVAEQAAADDQAMEETGLGLVLAQVHRAQDLVGPSWDAFLVGGQE